MEFCKELGGGGGGVGEKSDHTCVCVTSYPDHTQYEKFPSYYICTRPNCADFCVVGPSVSKPYTSELNGVIFLIYSTGL